jgi:hypothetical protein
MRISGIRIIILMSLMLTGACTSRKIPLALHSENPHYFLFRNKPVVLIGSTEHYGAVMNLEFNYISYLDELAARGLNNTRTFSGIYVEHQGAFGINYNTLAPGTEKFICPWKRSDEPGYPGGGNKFDLAKWDDGYFDRLKDFVSEAGKRGIIVELDLFSNFYDTIQWKLSPLYYSNNINGLKPVRDPKEILSLKHPDLITIQEKMVERILTELNAFDNVYYEVCNEPYFGDIKALDAWEAHMTEFIAGVERKLPLQHLISQNIQNGSFKVENPSPSVSIFNFHYAKPPVTVEMNYGLNKPIGDNETGFNGIEDVQYRTEAWDFMVAGGALFNNLDYSFTTDHPNGKHIVTPGQPGGGGESLRRQLQILKNVFDSIDFIHMRPCNSIIKSSLNKVASSRVLANEGNEYLFYFWAVLPGISINYALRYEGFLKAPVSGDYWFYTTSDDGIRLCSNGKLLIHNWTDHAATLDSALISLEAGEKVPILLDFYQSLGGAVLRLDWKLPGKGREAVPMSVLSAPDGKTPGLKVIKFLDREMKEISRELIVTKIDEVGISETKENSGKEFLLEVELPAGSYSGEWINTITNERTFMEIDDHKGGILDIKIPEFTEDIALKLKKVRDN